MATSTATNAGTKARRNPAPRPFMAAPTDRAESIHVVLFGSRLHTNRASRLESAPLSAGLAPATCSQCGKERTLAARPAPSPAAPPAGEDLSHVLPVPDQTKPGRRELTPRALVPDQLHLDRADLERPDLERPDLKRPGPSSARSSQRQLDYRRQVDQIQQSPGPRSHALRLPASSVVAPDARLLPLHSASPSAQSCPNDRGCLCTRCFRRCRRRDAPCGGISAPKTRRSVTRCFSLPEAAPHVSPRAYPSRRQP